MDLFVHWLVYDIICRFKFPDTLKDRTSIPILGQNAWVMRPVILMVLRNFPMSRAAGGFDGGCEHGVECRAEQRSGYGADVPAVKVYPQAH